LSEAGLTSEEIDLRDYFDDSLEVEARLGNFDLLWLGGGNVFMLRYALHRARADRAIQRLLVRDEVAYGGYSAGPCVLGPTIRGFERTDDPSIVERVYGQPPIWVGLGVIPYVVVPHVDWRGTQLPWLSADSPTTTSRLESRSVDSATAKCSSSAERNP
jgi:dipeptidase E